MKNGCIEEPQTNLRPQSSLYTAPSDLEWSWFVLFIEEFSGVILCRDYCNPYQTDGSRGW